jgi:regulatory protein
VREGPDGVHRPRPRNPSLAERRAERAGVDDPAVVIEAAARLLEARPRSEAEVRRRLTRAGYRADLVDTAVTRLMELGYLDDAEFARAWVASRDRARPRGEHALRRELTLKGVDRTAVDAALDDRRDAAGASPETAPGAGDPDEAAAERLITRRLPALLREPDPRRRRQKAYALLARNGFAPDVCSAVARRVIGDGHPSA